MGLLRMSEHISAHVLYQDHWSCRKKTWTRSEALSQGRGSQDASTKVIPWLICGFCFWLSSLLLGKLYWEVIQCLRIWIFILFMFFFIIIIPQVAGISWSELLTGSKNNTKNDIMYSIFQLTFVCYYIPEQEGSGRVILPIL